MHKIFAKTLFLGKNVVFLPQCHSTNQEARALNSSGSLNEGSVIWADYQERGRGQHGNAWLSERGKNLLFTIYLAPESLAPNNQYLLNLVSSLAIHQVVVSLLPTATVEIKWPNDIYINDLKIAGILNEVVISKGQLEHVYCGIGLNVNQSHFNLQSATSLQMISGVEFDREDILEKILLAFEQYYYQIKKEPIELISQYLNHLKWLGETRKFKISGVEDVGVITGIDDHGKLEVNIRKEVKYFDVKEIEFLH
ncbi:MAG: biotin--[acetyl-CoA-carboxylase] ligase [Cytophagales bacterium]|nr:biotin--[acetyl-CoA-carboxylase] ligase [Cytophagales bacterium]